MHAHTTYMPKHYNDDSTETYPIKAFIIRAWVECMHMHMFVMCVCWCDVTLLASIVVRAVLGHIYNYIYIYLCFL